MQGPELVVVDEGEDVRDGQAVFVAVLHGPLAEPREQTEGSLAWVGFVSGCWCILSSTWWDIPKKRPMKLARRSSER